jgi:hypothetical protein
MADQNDHMKQIAEEAAERTQTSTLPPDPDLDGLYFKYRVFREPDDVIDHPVGVDTLYFDINGKEQWLIEVPEFTFVLKPDSDHHARVAVAAYAESVAREKPRLAEDLKEILGSL